MRKSRNFGVSALSIYRPLPCYRCPPLRKPSQSCLLFLDTSVENTLGKGKQICSESGFVMMEVECQGGHGHMSSQWWPQSNLGLSSLGPGAFPCAKVLDAQGGAGQGALSVPRCFPVVSGRLATPGGHDGVCAKVSFWMSTPESYVPSLKCSKLNPGPWCSGLSVSGEDGIVVRRVRSRSDRPARQAASVLVPGRSVRNSYTPHPSLVHSITSFQPVLRCHLTGRHHCTVNCTVLCFPCPT